MAPQIEELESDVQQLNKELDVEKLKQTKKVKKGVLLMWQSVVLYTKCVLDIIECFSLGWLYRILAATYMMYFYSFKYECLFRLLSE